MRPVRYTVSIGIALPLEQVVHLLTDPAHLPRWLRDLVLHEPLDGEHGHVGTTSRVVRQTGKRATEATETVTRREPEDLREIAAGTVVRYEREIVADGMWNAARERLTETGPGTTLWES